MNIEELQDADAALNNRRRESAKTAFLTSIQTFLRLFLVAAVVALVGDWFLNRDIRHSLVSDNKRTVEWVAEHEKDYLKLLLATAQRETQNGADRETVSDMRSLVGDLQARMRRVESSVLVIQSINHSNGSK